MAASDVGAGAFSFFTFMIDVRCAPLWTTARPRSSQSTCTISPFCPLNDFDGSKA